MFESDSGAGSKKTIIPIPYLREMNDEEYMI